MSGSYLSAYRLPVVRMFVGCLTGRRDTQLNAGFERLSRDVLLSRDSTRWFPTALRRERDRTKTRYYHTNIIGVYDVNILRNEAAIKIIDFYLVTSSVIKQNRIQ